METEMIVYENFVYKKEKIGEKKFVNEIFEILDFIGRGSFWKVYLVKRNLDSNNPNEENLYVLKEAKLSSGNKYEFTSKYNNCEQKEYRRGLKEYSILLKINHINISRLYECIMDSIADRIVFIMEYADLGVLMNLNKNEENLNYNIKLINSILPDFREYESINFNKNHEILVKCIKIIFRQVAEALQYLHNKLIAHRDIKPDNIGICSKTNNIKLLDFSNAVSLNTENDKILSEGSTPAFDPPEILSKEYYNPLKGDIYSLGATIYVFLFNRFDYDLEPKGDVKILSYFYPSLFNLLKQMMETDPNKRLDIKSILNEEFFN